jgi:outer membrane protein insertion porin family
VPSEPSDEPHHDTSKHLSGKFQVGAGYNAWDKFIATAKVSHDNLFGSGNRLSLEAAISGRRTEAALRYTVPSVSDSGVSLSAEAGTSNRFFDDFSRNSYGARIRAQRELSPGLVVGLGYSLEEVQAAATNPLLPGKLLRGGTLSTLSGDFSYTAHKAGERVDTGFSQKLSLDISSGALGSDIGLLRAQKESGYSFTLHRFGDLTFRLRTQLGYLTSTDGQAVPVTERFFLNSPGVMRGISPNSLGPSLLLPDEPGGPLRRVSIGGTGIATASAEIELPLRKNLKGYVFLDAGNTFDGQTGLRGLSREDLDFGSLPLRTSAGVGLRWESPIGPIGVECGAPLDPRPGERPVLCQLRIGR